MRRRISCRAWVSKMCELAGRRHRCVVAQRWIRRCRDAELEVNGRRPAKKKIAMPEKLIANPKNHGRDGRKAAIAVRDRREPEFAGTWCGCGSGVSPGRRGRKVIDKATFQTFWLRDGDRGGEPGGRDDPRKTPAEAMRRYPGEDLAAELGPTAAHRELIAGSWWRRAAVGGRKPAGSPCPRRKAGESRRQRRWIA